MMLHDYLYPQYQPNAPKGSVYMCEITTLLHHYPKRHGLSIEWLADTIGVPKSTLQRYLSLNEELALPFPLRLLIPFMRACNNDFSALDALESRIGRHAYSTGASGIKIDCKAVAALAKEAGEAISTMAIAIADDKISHDERMDCIKQLLDLQMVTASILMQLNQ
jgi:DNA-binding IclR family transcriptional regulator